MDYVYSITGIPDRKDRSNGGGDTGEAVFLRDGFQSLEIVARVKERNFRKAERRSLRMICEILRRFNGINLRPMDIDVKFIRNRTTDLLNKSQAFSYLMKTQQISPVDGIALISVTNDPQGMAKRGQDYWNSGVPTPDDSTPEGNGNDTGTKNDPATAVG